MSRHQCRLICLAKRQGRPAKSISARPVTWQRRTGRLLISWSLTV